MSKKKKKNCDDGCFDCDNCCYIGEGDYICDIHGEIVIVEFGEPTEDFYCCKGKEHTPI